jgi:hypothetical protein
MVSKEIVCFDNVHILDLGGLQNFPGAFRTRDVGTGPDLPPFTERTGDPNLGPNAQDRRDDEIEKPVLTAKTDWIEHFRLSVSA